MLSIIIKINDALKICKKKVKGLEAICYLIKANQILIKII